VTDAERRGHAAVLWGYIDTQVVVTGGDCFVDGMAPGAFRAAYAAARALEVAYWGKPYPWLMKDKRWAA
jgi:hypothetical protein